MGHFVRLLDAGKDLRDNLSVYGVMLLQYLVVMLLFFLFGMLDLVLLVKLNASAISALGPNLTTVPPAAMINAIWNAKTITLVGTAIVIEALLVTFIASWFTAGAYGMIRNLLLDGSTTIKEFSSMARRFVWPLFRFALLRLALFAIPAIPFAMALLSMSGTTETFITSSQIVFFVVSAMVFTLVALVVALLLLYGEAIIVFEDVGAIAAAKRTFVLVRKNPGTSIIAGLLALGAVIVVTVLFMIIVTPVQTVATTTQSTAWTLGGDVLSFVQNLALIFVGLAVTIFIFRTYRHITGGVVRTTSYQRTKRKNKRSISRYEDIS